MVDSWPERLWPWSEVPQGRPALPDDTRPCPSSQVVHQLSQATHNPVRRTAVTQAGLDDSLLGLSSRSVDQLSQTTRTRIRGPADWISCPGLLVCRSECPRCRSALPGDSGPCPRSRSVDQMSRVTGPVSEGPWGRPSVLGNSCSGPCLQIQPAVPDDSGPCPSSRGVDQLSRDTQASVQVPAGSTSSPT